MAKNKLIKNNDPSINFRLSKKLKNIIEEKSQDRNITTSAYIRNLLERVHNGNYCKKEQVKAKINSFLVSREFLQLMIWIYTKRVNNKKTEEDSELQKYIKTLKKVDGHLPENLVKEFDKVLNDIFKVRSENSYSSDKFDFFVATNEAKRLNITMVEEFLLNDIRINNYILMKGLVGIINPLKKGV